MRKSAKFCAMLLASAMVFGLVALAAPQATLAASPERRAAFAGLSESNYLTYDTPLPTGGRPATAEEINSILSHLWDLNPVNYDDARHAARLYIAKQAGSVTYAEKYECWNSSQQANNYYIDSLQGHNYYYFLDKTLNLAGEYAGKTFNYLYRRDDSMYDVSMYSYSYSWVDGSKTGFVVKMELDLGYWVPPEMPDYRDFRIYADETVLGETCFVYSYAETTDDGDSYTYYEWLSRISGSTIKSVQVDGEYIWTSIYFFNENIDIPLSFFDVPAGVTFTEDWYEWRNDIGSPSAPSGSAAVTAFVTRLYRNVLEREPDQSGLDAWVARLSSQEWGGGQVAETFFFDKVHQEFIKRGLSNEEFLRIMYATFMDRAPDDTGWNAWLERMAGGMKWEEVFNGFVVSQEWGDRCDQAGIKR